MNKIRRKIIKLRDSNEGVVGIFVALLLIGLFIVVISFVQTVYVPQWMKEKEAEHMDQVANQFSQLKFAIDTLSVAAQQYSPISSPITLGSKEMPFLSSSRAYGSLDILPNEYKITITDNNAETVSYALGSIKYDSTNAYYMDQSYVYENGALILSQHSGDLIAVKPAFSILEKKDLSLNLIRLSGIGGKTSASGYGTYPVQTKFYSSSSSLINHVSQITIYNSYTNAWKNFFNDFLSGSALDYSIDNTADNDGITITFFDTVDADLPELTFKVTDIEIQISPGWVQ